MTNPRSRPQQTRGVLVGADVSRRPDPDADDRDFGRSQEGRERRTRARGVVSHLANKIDMLGTTPNVDYAGVVTADLMGYMIEMRRVPMLRGCGEPRPQYFN